MLIKWTLPFSPLPCLLWLNSCVFSFFLFFLFCQSFDFICMSAGMILMCIWKSHRDKKININSTLYRMRLMYSFQCNAMWRCGVGMHSKKKKIKLNQNGVSLQKKKTSNSSYCSHVVQIIGFLWHTTTTLSWTATNSTNLCSKKLCDFEQTNNAAFSSNETMKSNRRQQQKHHLQ